MKRLATFLVAALIGAFVRAEDAVFVQADSETGEVLTPSALEGRLSGIFTVDQEARDDVAEVQESFAEHAGSFDNPHAVTPEQIGALTAETDAIALAAIPTNAVCVGGWINPDAFVLAPQSFVNETNITDEAFTTNAEYVARILTLEGAGGWHVNPTVLRHSDTNLPEISWAVTSAAGTATFSNDAVYFNGETGAVVTGTLGAWTVATNFPAIISPPTVQTQAYSAVAGTVRARIDGVLRPGIEAGKTNVVMVGMTGNSNQIPVLANLAWNTNCWLGTNQPTCVSWSNSGYAVRCALITSNAVIAARHWGPLVGNEILFMDSTGGHHRTTAINEVFPAPTNKTDMKLLLVSPALPASVRPVKFLPDDYASYIADEFHLPVMFFDKFYRASVGFMRSGGMESTPYAIVDAPRYEPWSAYYRTPVSGDSGNPVLLPFGGDNFALLTLWYTPVYGPNYIQFRNNVVTGLVALGASTNIQIVDFNALGLSPLGE